MEEAMETEVTLMPHSRTVVRTLTVRLTADEAADVMRFVDYRKNPDNSEAFEKLFDALAQIRDMR
jgi:accessory colonization factor AcfC